MSLSRYGVKNYYQGKRLDSNLLISTQKIRGKLIYSEKDKSLFKNSSFVSMRESAEHLPINPGTLKIKLYTGVPFKGYYYYYSVPLK